MVAMGNQWQPMVTTGQTMVTKDKQWWTFEVLGPSMIYNGYNCSKYALNFKFPIITH